jgi:hypothetical protein
LAGTWADLEVYRVRPLVQHQYLTTVIRHKDGGRCERTPHPCRRLLSRDNLAHDISKWVKENRRQLSIHVKMITSSLNCYYKDPCSGHQLPSLSFLVHNEGRAIWLSTTSLPNTSGQLQYGWSSEPVRRSSSSSNCCLSGIAGHSRSNPAFLKIHLWHCLKDRSRHGEGERPSCHRGGYNPLQSCLGAKATDTIPSKAGMPRTGTSSLQEALKILGYSPCHHMVSDVLGDVSGRAQRWKKAWNTTDKQQRHAIIRDILADYRAVVDFPASIMIDDMHEIYPNAKVSAFKPRPRSPALTRW